MTSKFGILLSDGFFFEVPAEGYAEKAEKDARETAKIVAKGREIIKVTLLGVYVDWTKPWLNIEEMAAYLGYSPKAIQEMVDAGNKIPRSTPIGKKGLFSREWADRLVLNSMTNKHLLAA